MIVAIHQPNFLPWAGYFYKILKSDIFIILDDVQFTKNSYINRNKIKTPNGNQWISVPVKSKGRFGQLINEVEINSLEKTKRKIKNSIKVNYGKSKYFNEIFSMIEPMFESNMLSEVNESLIIRICKFLNIQTRFVRSSVLHTQQFDSTEKLINLCKEVNATTYLSGFGGNKYQDSLMFNKNDIELKTSTFIHPNYPQLWGGFIPNLSIIDLLFNCGKESIRYLNR